MATHRADVSVSFRVPSEAAGPRNRRSESIAGERAAGPVAPDAQHAPDLVGVELATALERLQDRGVTTRIHVVGEEGPIGSVVWQDPPAGTLLGTTDFVIVGVITGTPVCVPAVKMRTEREARAEIAHAGLVPGRRIPTPRPVSGRAEIVIRTRPSAGATVPAGSVVDYELIPGEPSGSTLSRDVAAVSAPMMRILTRACGYVDYDVIDTLFRPTDRRTRAGV